MPSRPTSVRLPVELQARIDAVADEERRSLHQTLLLLLEEALDAREGAARAAGKAERKSRSKPSDGTAAGAVAALRGPGTPCGRRHTPGVYCKPCGKTPA